MREEEEKLAQILIGFSCLIFFLYFYNMPSFYCCHKKEMFKCVCKHTMREKKKRKTRVDYCLVRMFDERERKEKNDIERRRNPINIRLIHSFHQHIL
jgi:hypothetical protein